MEYEHIFHMFSDFIGGSKWVYAFLYVIGCIVFAQAMRVPGLIERIEALENRLNDREVSK